MVQCVDVINGINGMIITTFVFKGKQKSMSSSSYNLACRPTQSDHDH